jgi:hypothetical protein
MRQVRHGSTSVANLAHVWLEGELTADLQNPPWRGPRDLPKVGIIHIVGYSRVSSRPRWIGRKLWMVECIEGFKEQLGS